MCALSSDISVIVPTYNRKHLTVRTIKNILNQSCRPLEVIVVDDHSKDGTYEYLKEIFNNSIILLKNEGKGPGAARNTGFKVSRGQYIKFFDSDDLMSSDMLEHQVNLLKESKESLVFSPYFHALENGNGSWKIMGNTILSFKNALERQGLQRRMLDGLFICIPSMLFERELLEKVGPWREDVVAYEDWEFLWRISNYEKFPAHTNQCAFLYRIHDEQTTSENLNDRERDLQKLQTFKLIYEIFIKNNTQLSSFRQASFLVQMYQTWKLYMGDKEFNNYEFLNKSEIKILSYYKRLSNKIGRFKTKNSWQPMHGTLNSENQINNYLKKIQ